MTNNHESSVESGNDVADQIIEDEKRDRIKLFLALAKLSEKSRFDSETGMYVASLSAPEYYNLQLLSPGEGYRALQAIDLDINRPFVFDGIQEKDASLTVFGKVTDFVAEARFSQALRMTLKTLRPLLHADTDPLSERSSGTFLADPYGILPPAPEAVVAGLHNFKAVAVSHPPFGQNLMRETTKNSEIVDSTSIFEYFFTVLQSASDQLQRLENSQRGPNKGSDDIILDNKLFGVQKLDDLRNLPDDLLAFILYIESKDLHSKNSDTGKSLEQAKKREIELKAYSYLFGFLLIAAVGSMDAIPVDQKDTLLQIALVFGGLRYIRQTDITPAVVRAQIEARVSRLKGVLKKDKKTIKH